MVFGKALSKIDNNNGNSSCSELFQEKATNRYDQNCIIFIDGGVAGWVLGGGGRSKGVYILMVLKSKAILVSFASNL